MEVLKDYGYAVDEKRFQDALKACNPDLHFDVASRRGWSHLRQSQWQGIWLHENHVGSMGRAQLPEFDLWASKGSKRLFILQLGWRDTAQRLVNRKVPGVTMLKLERLLNVPHREFIGTPQSLDIGQKNGWQFVA